MNNNDRWFQTLGVLFFYLEILNVISGVKIKNRALVSEEK